MTSGKRAIKNNERNYPVENSIRLRKEATAPTAAEFDTPEFQVGEEVLVPGDTVPWVITSLSPGGTWVVAKRTEYGTIRTYHYEKLKRVSEKA